MKSFTEIGNELARQSILPKICSCQHNPIERDSPHWGAIVVNDQGEFFIYTNFTATKTKTAIPYLEIPKSTLTYDFFERPFVATEHHLSPRSSSPSSHEVTASDVRSTPSAASQLRVDRLARIQGTLGVSTHDFAAFLYTSRAGLYKWLDASKNIDLQETKRSRLNKIESLVKAWKECSNAPLKPVLREPLATGKTIYELLTAQNIDDDAVINAFKELAEKLQAKPKSWAQRMAEAGFTRRPVERLMPDEE